jgi:hypothetical protein
VREFPQSPTGGLGSAGDPGGLLKPGPIDPFGDWDLVALECQGNRFPAADVWLLSDPAPVHPLIRFSINENLRVLSRRSSGSVREVCSIVVNSKGHNVAIDLVRRTGRLPGIIKYSHGALFVCVAIDPKGSRPEDFSTRRGDNRLLLLYAKRTKGRAGTRDTEPGLAIETDTPKRPVVPRAGELVTLDSLVEDPKAQSLPDIAQTRLMQLPLSSLRELARIYSDQRKTLEQGSKRFELYSEEFKREHLLIEGCRTTLDAFDRWSEESETYFQRFGDKLKALSQKWSDMSKSRRVAADGLSQILERIREQERKRGENLKP